jgi:hypothetical protein
MKYRPFSERFGEKAAGSELSDKGSQLEKAIRGRRKQLMECNHEIGESVHKNVYGR